MVRMPGPPFNSNLREHYCALLAIRSRWDRSRCAAGSVVFLAALTVAAFCSLFLGSPKLSAYTPEDPIVVDMVDRAVAYLNKTGIEGPQDYSGAPIVVGYAIYKATGEKENKLVQAALKAATKVADDVRRLEGLGQHIVYEAGAATLLLADVDPMLYRPQLLQLRDFFRSVQKPQGGFGYLSSQTGDTSQIQYAMLGMWALQKNEIDVSMDSLDSCIRFMVMTQDPKGGWGYQTSLPPGSSLVPQTAVSKSLSTAGICGLLLGADAVGILAKRGVLEEDPDVPRAFVRIDINQKERLKNNASKLKVDDISSTVTKANEYQRSTPFPTPGSNWYYYYRYAEERYESFLEVYNGKRERSPAWYNNGVDELRKFQNQQGAFGVTPRDSTSPELSTALAILYLIRSTQKTIAKLNEGVMAGGYGLPSDAGTVRRVGDRIISEETASVDGLLEMMEKNKTDNVEVGLLPENMALSKDPAVRKSQVARLARLLSGRDWKSRRIAARLLGRSEDINQVPELIYALTDPDAEVPVIAEESLRLLSRKLTVRNVEVESTIEQKLQAAKYWREWYLSMRPDYVFLDK